MCDPKLNPSTSLSLKRGRYADYTNKRIGFELNFMDDNGGLANPKELNILSIGQISNEALLLTTLTALC